MKALIISLNFHPGHVSHMVASYKQCEELGFESEYYVNQQFTKYLPSSSKIVRYGVDKCPEADLAIFLFPSQKNLQVIFKLRYLKQTKIFYIFHEPIESFKEYKESGYSNTQLILERIKHWVSALTVRIVDEVLLPSYRAIHCFESNKIYRNKNYHYLPLMYDDEQEECHSRISRMYFSYIGTVAEDHSFQNYLDFVCWAVHENQLPELKFMIATKSEFEVPEELKKSIRVNIIKGNPLTDEEINIYFASSFVVWNAYARTTQSGVLAKSFMFGTPALVLKKNINEFAHDGVEIRAIEDNNDKKEITAALETILKDFDRYSENCRNMFMKSFYYRKYNNEFAKLIK